MQTRTKQCVLRSENKPFAEFILMFCVLFCFVGQMVIYGKANIHKYLKISSWGQTHKSAPVWEPGDCCFLFIRLIICRMMMASWRSDSFI